MGSATADSRYFHPVSSDANDGSRALADSVSCATLRTSSASMVVVRTRASSFKKSVRRLLAWTRVGTLSTLTRSPYPTDWPTSASNCCVSGRTRLSASGPRGIAISDGSVRA